MSLIVCPEGSEDWAESLEASELYRTKRGEFMKFAAEWTRKYAV